MKNTSQLLEQFIKSGDLANNELLRLSVDLTNIEKVLAGKGILFLQTKNFVSNQLIQVNDMLQSRLEG